MPAATHLENSHHSERKVLTRALKGGLFPEKQGVDRGSEERIMHSALKRITLTIIQRSRVYMGMHSRTPNTQPEYTVQNF